MRSWIFGVAVLGVAFVLGCGESSEQEPEVVESPPIVKTQGQFERPGHLPYASSKPLAPAVLDTLRRLKKTHNVTRDETWPGQGGVLGNDFFEVWYPEGITMVTHAMRLLNDMMLARAKFEDYFGRVPMERLVILLPPYLDQFTEWTGRGYWFYSEIRADTMTIQPIYILIRRGIADYAVPHEYFQWAIGHVTNFGAPRWLEEGMASYLSREGPILAQQILEFPEETHTMSLDRIEEVLLREESRQESRIAYYHSYRIVQSLVDRFGEDTVKGVVLQLGKGLTMDEACRESFGMSYNDVIASVGDTVDEI